MSWATDRLAEIDAELARRADGGYVESYSTEGGTQITTVPWEKLMDRRERLQKIVDREQGTRSSFILARTRPR